MLAASFSKDLGIPGERIGFLALSPKIDGWNNLVDAAVFANRTLGFVNAPALMQRVITELGGVTINLDWYRRKRDRLHKSLTDMGYEVAKEELSIFSQKLHPMTILLLSTS